MAAVFPDTGKKLALDILLAAGRNPKLKLFKNNVAVTDATVLGDLTEANFSGYAAKDLSAIAAASINGSDQGERHSNANNFVHSGGGTANTIYGWYIVIDDLAATPALILCENFPTPLVVAAVPNHVEFDLSILDELGS